ncbi:MAG TPA: glycosyltransferase family 39 protein [Patescibacteria group bacterium]|nr:glycosyltransferase family 39 protein [Patescibacteria group bacterium]
MWKWFLVVIFLLGFLFRVIGISNHPAGFTPDEASFGYDAYSILKTGKDQWGNTLPLVFKSFGDDKLPAYVYLTIPSVAVFGLNEFAVRLPNAILGTLAILVVYLLVEEIFKDKRLSLLSALLFAISPWSIMLSRGAFEANLTTFFLPLGILFFLKSLKNRRYLLLSFLVFLVNIFTYHTARILTPLIFFSLLFIYKNELKDKKIFNISLVLSNIVLFVAAAGFLIGGSRVASSSIADINFADDRYFAQVVGEPSIISKVFYNKPIYVSIQFVKNYLSYFSPQFLFTNGPAEGTYGMVPGIGVLYFVEVLFLTGFVWSFFKEGQKKEILFLLFWILISPIPAALTKGPGYAANRSEFVMPAIQIVLAIGGFYIYENLKNKKWKNYFIYGMTILFLINFIYVFEKYWIGQTVNQASDMIYGTSQIVNNLKSTNAKQIMVAKDISEPQIYFAFYTKMDPRIYQQFSKNWQLINGWVDQQGSYKLANYTFRDINYNVDKNLQNTILIGKPNDFPADSKPTLQINYPNLKPAYYIFNE